MTNHVARRHRRPIAALAAAALTLGVGSGVAFAADESVDISSFAFSPATVTITAGDTVTWTNADPVAHTATATDGSWDTGDIAEGASASITFDAPGTFSYLCTPHPTMTGTVVVEAAAGGGGGGGGGGGATLPPTDGVAAPAAESAETNLAVPLGLVIGGLFAAASFVRRRGPNPRKRDAES